ncbi:hypothetical protein CYCD_21090 [Tenuifilaceae bacterium CYCD]|nr:hypothetical protein CYCD_21090 [Tenuifilaceae bacterium CYCD]
MKRIVIACSFVTLITLKGYTQDLNNNHIGVIYYSGASTVLRNDLSKSNDFRNGHGYLVGISYYRVYNDYILWESGINFSRNYYRVTKELDNYRWSTSQPLEIVSIPISLLIKTRQGFFVSPGVQLDLEVNHWTKYIISNQSGLGCCFSIGKIFHISENYYLLMAPIVKVHSIISFGDFPEYRSMEYGVKFVISYGFLQ